MASILHHTLVHPRSWFTRHIPLTSHSQHNVCTVRNFDCFAFVYHIHMLLISALQLVAPESERNTTPRCHHYPTRHEGNLPCKSVERHHSVSTIPNASLI